MAFLIPLILWNSLPLAFSQSPPGDIKWRTGKQLDDSNQLALSAWWTDAPIRDRITTFSIHQQFGCFLDRRIDPTLKINTGIDNGTTEQFLWRVAAQQGLGVCRLEDFYYFGPLPTAAKLPIAWNELKTETHQSRKSFKVAWNKQQAIQTTAIVQPKSLLQQLAADNHFEIQNLDALPHDVWSGFQLPPTTLEGRVAIILVGFDKWFTRSPDGTSIEIVDFPEILKGTTLFEGLDDARSAVKNLRRKNPELKISFKGKTRMSASGDPTDLARLRKEMVDAQIPRIDPNSISVFSLKKTRAPRIAILQRIAEQTKHPLTLPSPQPRALLELVEIDVQDASLREIIQAVLKESNLKFDLAPGKLTISAK